MAIFLKRFPKELLSLIFGFLDVTDIELRLKPTGDKYLLSLLSSRDLPLALKLESSVLACYFPFSRFAGYRSMYSLSIQISNALASYSYGLIGLLPPTLREIRLFCFGAEALFCRPLCSSDDRVTHALFSSIGYTVLSVRDHLPNLTLLHVYEPNNGSARLLVPPTGNPLPKAYARRSFPLDLQWTVLMSWRLIEHLPPTITSLMLDRALYFSTKLLSPYLSILFNDEALRDVYQFGRYLRLQEDLIPAHWPSIAAHLPNLQHLVVHPSRTLDPPFLLGKGMNELYQQLKTLCWYHSGASNPLSVLASNQELCNLVSFYPVEATSTESYQCLSYLETLHIVAAHKLVEIGAFPSNLQSLTLNVPFMQLETPLKLPSQLTYFDSFESAQNASIYSEFPETLRTIHINLAATGGSIDLSRLPRKLVELRLASFQSNCFTPEDLRKLPPGLATLELRLKNSRLTDAHIENLPRGLASLELSELKRSFLAFLPPRLQYLTCSPACTLMDTDLILLPHTLITLKLSAVQTNGSLLPRDLTRLNLYDIMNTIRQNVPPAISSPSGVLSILERLCSDLMSNLPTNLTSIDLRGTNLAVLRNFDYVPLKLPSLTKLRVMTFGYLLGSIHNNLKYLEVSEDAWNSYCHLISQMPVIETLKIPRGSWDSKYELPKTLKRLHIAEVLGKEAVSLLRPLPQLQVLKFTKEKWLAFDHRSCDFDVDFGQFPASLVKLKIGATSIPNIRVSVVTSEANPVPNLQVLEMPSPIWSWSDVALLPRSITVLHTGNVTATSKEVLSRVSESQWTNILNQLNVPNQTNSESVKLNLEPATYLDVGDNKGAVSSSGTMDPNFQKFQDLVLQSILPNAKFHLNSKLSIVWHMDDLASIPRGYQNVIISDSVKHTPTQVWAVPYVKIPAKKQNTRLFSNLPCDLTRLCVAVHIITPHSIPGHLPRYLTHLSVNVSHWNQKSFSQLPLSLTSLEIEYRKEVTAQFLSWLPRQLLRLDTLRGTRFSSSRRTDKSLGKSKAATPILSQLPPVLETLVIRSRAGLVAEDFKYLPRSITALDVEYFSEEFRKYTGDNVKFWGDNCPIDETRLFADLYGLPLKK